MLKESIDRTHDENDSKKIYEEKIGVIQRYYDISKDAAVYIYFRRKRSFPWKKKSDQKYLFWNAKLQNALIMADGILGFNWQTLEYGKEEETLKNFGIYIRDQSNNLFRKYNDNFTEATEQEDNDWIINKKKKKVKTNFDKLALQKMGLLPKM